MKHKYARTPAVAIGAVVALCISSSHSSHAFTVGLKSRDDIPLFSMINDSLKIHQDITRDALMNFRTLVRGVPRGFEEEAIEQIIEQNVQTDDELSDDPVAHFDSEKIDDGADRLKRFRVDIVDELIKPYPDSSTVYRLLGQAFHALQDFYSHSNAVEREEEHGIEPFIVFGGDQWDPKMEPFSPGSSDCSLLG